MSDYLYAPHAVCVACSCWYYLRNWLRGLKYIFVQGLSTEPGMLQTLNKWLMLFALLSPLLLSPCWWQSCYHQGVTHPSVLSDSEEPHSPSVTITFSVPLFRRGDGSRAR